MKDAKLYELMELKHECRSAECFDCAQFNAHAAQKKLLEWLSERCKKHGKSWYVTTRRRCPKCWQSLLKDFGL